MWPNLPVLFERAEGVGLFLAATGTYSLADGPWLWFAFLLLAADVSMFGYAFGPRVGAVAYNAGHFLVLPLALALAGWVLDAPWFLWLALIWFAHIWMDRALGFGLKHSDSFKHTHLGTIGGRPGAKVR